ncbi:hypothetical protein CAEBREN_23896 [Caenorhabditis brenneri]|uniref:Uncharacterized protein n=1 Tax=Caenorhabditis brenneri TaxID=135651 RepID=G0N1S2_CAEBE|nr:hypothetical protein CAEBREN_23896 [Caenorhabditis brenneri]
MESLVLIFRVVNMSGYERYEDMEWVQMYAGRPSSSRPPREPVSPSSVAESELKEANDFVSANAHVPLKELLAQNKEAQKLKAVEYCKLKARKVPTLEEQERGPNGRIIFSQAYIDHIFYRELQPLIDLRVLRYIEEIITKKIEAEDGKKVEETEQTHETVEETVEIRSLFSIWILWSRNLDQAHINLPFVLSRKQNSAAHYFYGVASTKNAVDFIRRIGGKPRIFQ